MDENHTQTQEPMADSGDKPRAGREMLVQLQQMIDTLATQAGPVMREVAAKAAELAAVAGEKAGPLAMKAAGVTGQVGQRVAARSKEMAADLRRPREGGDADSTTEPIDEPMAEPMSDAMSYAPSAEVPNEEMGQPD